MMVFNVCVNGTVQCLYIWKSFIVEELLMISILIIRLSLLLWLLAVGVYGTKQILLIQKVS